jgi:hypothetical protein
MKMNEIAEMARKLDVKVGRLNKATLIQAIQLAEGNIPCFAVGRASECGQSTCIWKEDCV